MSTKIIQLKARAEYPDLNLAKGEPYYPATSVDAVKGLDEVIDGKIVKYAPATENADGLMSSADKKKLDSLKEKPLDGLNIKAPDGTIYILSITNDGEIKVVKEDDHQT